MQAKEEAVQAKQEAVQAKQEAVQAKQEVVQAKQEVDQAKQEAIQAKQDAEQAKQAAATLMEEYERRKLSAAASESASSGLSLGQTIGVAVGCSLAVLLLVALGLFVLMRGRHKGGLQPQTRRLPASNSKLNHKPCMNQVNGESRTFIPAMSHRRSQEELALRTG